MIRIWILLFFILGVLSVSAQSKMYIHRTDHLTDGISISNNDSMYFNSAGSVVYFSSGNTTIPYTTSDIDSMSFGEDSNTITVTYRDDEVYVVNPLAYEGVSVTVSGADVTVHSTTDTKDINYQLSGTTSDGMFKVYSEKRFNLLLNGVSITNSDGPAINIQAKNKVSVTLMDGTTSSLTDGSEYIAAPIDSAGKSEDQKAAFFSEGKLVFGGTGTLEINGNGEDKSALCSDGSIQIDQGIIGVNSAMKDGIHGKSGVFISDGMVDVTASGDGIDGDEGCIAIFGGSVTVNCPSADVKGICSDSTLTISGGIINLTMSGDQSKGLTSKQPMNLSGGDITIKTSGGVILEALGSGYDPSYATAIKGDSTSVNFSGANVNIVCNGAANKAISADGNITVSGGTIKVTATGSGATYKNSSGTTDSYASTCLTSDSTISILNGTIILSNSGSGGDGISCDGMFQIGDSNHSPELSVTTTGSSITISSGSTGGGGGWGGGWGGGGGGFTQTTNADEAKAITCNGAIVINNGTTTISSANDGIKSDASITINGGTVSIEKSYEGIEAPAITVNDGTVSVISSDDGFNASKGNGGEANDGSLLTLNGGKIYVNASSNDGLDSNGSIAMTGGTVVVHGPQSSPDVGMDYNGTCNISGGLLVVAGPNSGNMIQGVSTSSSQYSVKATSSSLGTNIFHIQDASGNEIVTFKPVRSIYYVVFSSPDLKNGSTYSVYTGGTSTGTSFGGLYTGGTYSGGTQKKSFTVSSKTTTISF